MDRISEWKRRDEERRRELEARRRREREEELRRLRERDKEDRERRRERAERGEAPAGSGAGSGASSGDEVRDEDEPVRKRGRKGRSRGPPSTSDSEPGAELEREVGAHRRRAPEGGRSWDGPSRHPPPVIQLTSRRLACAGHRAGCQGCSCNVCERNVGGGWVAAGHNARTVWGLQSVCKGGLGSLGLLPGGFQVGTGQTLKASAEGRTLRVQVKEAIGKDNREASQAGGAVHPKGPSLCGTLEEQ